jgi:hypothetical protein
LFIPFTVTFAIINLKEEFSQILIHVVHHKEINSYPIFSFYRIYHV